MTHTSTTIAIVIRDKHFRVEYKPWKDARKSVTVYEGEKAIYYQPSFKGEMILQTAKYLVEQAIGLGAKAKKYKLI